MNDKEEVSMIGIGLPSETSREGAPVYADSTIRAKADLKALDQRQEDDSGPAVSLTPREQLQIQVWQSIHFTASNAMLEASERGDAEDIALAYKIMDMVTVQLNVAMKKVQGGHE